MKSEFKLPTVKELAIVAATLARNTASDPHETAKAALKQWAACADVLQAEQGVRERYEAAKALDAAIPAEPLTFDRGLKWLMPTKRIDEATKLFRGWAGQSFPKWKREGFTLNNCLTAQKFFLPWLSRNRAEARATRAKAAASARHNKKSI